MSIKNLNLNLNQRRAAGFTLLELLIAIMIFAIGLLGIASLQIAGLRYTHASQMRVNALMHAENLADRMRANPTGVINGDYDVGTDLPTESADCSVDECTSQQMAVYDLFHWRGSLSSELNPELGLPAGTGSVAIIDANANIYAITVQWTERGAGAGDPESETKTLTLRFKPR